MKWKKIGIGCLCAVGLCICIFGVLSKRSVNTEPVVHSLAENTESTTGTTAVILDDGGNSVTASTEVDKEPVISTPEQTSEAEITEDANQDIVASTEEVASTEMSTEDDTSDAIVAEVDVDIPSFSDDSSGSNDSKPAYKSYNAQVVDTITGAEFSVNGKTITINNTSETRYKVWSVYNSAGELLTTTDVIAPAGSRTWDVPDKYFTDGYAELSLVTMICESDSVDSKITTVKSKIKIELED